MRGLESRHTLNHSVAVVTVLCLLLWAVTPFRAIEVGLETTGGAYGIVIYGGSVIFGAHAHRFPRIRPFAHLTSFTTFEEGRTTAWRTLRGRFSSGHHPDYPWIQGISFPMWLFTLGAGIAWLAGFRAFRGENVNKREV